MAGLMTIDIETYSDVSLPDCGVLIIIKLGSHHS